MKAIAGEFQHTLVAAKIWWWNEEVKEAVSRKKETHKAMCQNSTEENMRRNKIIQNAKKAVSK